MGISNALKAATKATEDVLQRFLPAWLPGRTEIAAGAGYVEYAGSPVGNLATGTFLPDHARPAPLPRREDPPLGRMLRIAPLPASKEPLTLGR